MKAGNILDALDYLGTWYPAIIVEENHNKKKIHFLPFQNSKRDEWFSEEDSNKIAPAFSNADDIQAEDIEK